MAFGARCGRSEAVVRSRRSVLVINGDVGGALGAERRFLAVSTDVNADAERQFGRVVVPPSALNLGLSSDERPPKVHRTSSSGGDAVLAAASMISRGPWVNLTLPPRRRHCM